MNQLLFDRSSGNLSPETFARIQTSTLVRAIQPGPRLRFNGGEKAASLENDADNTVDSQVESSAETRIWAHQAGANALALDIESRMYMDQASSIYNADANSLISGGADSSIKVWDLEECTTGSKYVFKPIGEVPR